MNITFHRLLPLFFFLVLAACAAPLRVPDEPAASAVAPVDTVTAVPTETQTPLPSTPKPPGPACFTELGRADLQAEVYAEFPEAILEYLNAGGSPVSLSDYLNFEGVAAQPISVAIADFTGDGLDDVAAALINPANPASGANLLLYRCVLNGYDLAFNLPANETFTRGFTIWYWQDLDADGADELVASQGLCGAHTCFEDLLVLSWNGTMLANRLEDSTAELPYPVIGVADPDGDGVYQIEVESGGFGSVGAGPQRSITWIWRPDPVSGMWQQVEERPSPSVYRIHVLHDADDAASRADYDYAVQLYRRVIDDDNLDEWLVDGDNPAVAAYARYRIAVIAVALDDSAAAEEMIAEMEALYPVGSRLHDFVEMAILFRTAFASGGLGAACRGAAGFAESHAPVVLATLGSEVYGYANRDYTGESICPAPDAP